MARRKIIIENKCFIVFIAFFLFAILVMAGCSPVFTPAISPQTQITNTIYALPSSTGTLIPPTKTPSATATITSTLTITPSPTPNEPVGCLQPPDDYNLITINGMLINQRTYKMLEHAQSLYQGEIDLTGYHLTQGSYSNEVSASFGTHAGGGAVDISVIQYGTYKVLYEDIEKLIPALRIAGFAAWLRYFDELYPGSPIHIHAIAIGDRDLSQPARDQLTGEFGYFRGFNGLPQPVGKPPIPDEYGNPIICEWMLAMGYSDLQTSSP